MAMRAFALASAVALANAMELTGENWDKETAGKTVFVKFLAPWCGHCKRMKPDWDKLMAEYKGSPTTLIGDVDCTTGGKELCNKMGVRGYPSIKHGDPNNLEDYKGGRSLSDLQKFAKENLGPTCGPANLDLCDAASKALIDEYMKMSDADLTKNIKEKDDKMAQVEKDFKEFTDGLQKSYKEASDKQEKDLEEVKSSGLGMMKSVQAHKAKGGKSEL